MKQQWNKLNEGVKSPRQINEELMEECLNGFYRELTSEEIIERFGNRLSEQQKQMFREMKMAIENPKIKIEFI